MKNKLGLKKCLVLVLISSMLLTCVFVFIYSYQYHVYKSNYNYKVVSLLSVIRKKFPDIDERELVSVLNSESDFNRLDLTKYGVNIDVDDIILENVSSYIFFKVINLCFFWFSFIVIISIFLFYIYNKDKKVKELTKLLEKINNGDYSLDIDSISEDELSILKNELYKTTIKLKEQAINERDDKINLKNSLEDISHQLKTPLTSIMISIDNIIENPNMEDSVKMKFIKSINREVSNISFLVQSILKLSKLDANTIEFFRKKVSVSDIISDSVSNVSLICDLKNVEVVTSVSKDIKLFCDSKWQVEAITNILKNAVEHSVSGDFVSVVCSQNKILTKVVIKSNSVIDHEDLPNIFKRFYKGRNASVDSVGIGLALSKTIIEKDNGKVYVNSSLKDGTVFTIKYYNF